MTRDANRGRDETIAHAIHAPLDASITRDESAWIVELRRDFLLTPANMWAMLTQPDLLSRWSPIVPDRPLTTAGRAISRENPGDDPVDATVITVVDGRILEHHWGTDVLRWTISPGAAGSLLTLRQSAPDAETAAMMAAGWQVCWGRLAVEDGTDRERPTGQRALDYGWVALRDHYAAEVADTS